MRASWRWLLALTGLAVVGLVGLAIVAIGLVGYLAWFAHGEHAATPSSVTGSAAAFTRLRTLKLDGMVTALVPLQDGTLLAGCRGDSTYRRCDPASGQLVGEFRAQATAGDASTFGPDNRAMALSADGQYLLTANYLAHRVSIIDLARQQLVAAPYCTGSPYRFEVCGPGGAWVLTDRGVCWLDLGTKALGQPQAAADLLTTPDQRTRYVLLSSQAGAHPQLLIQGPAGPERRIDLGPVPRDDGGALALSADGRRLYVLLAGAKVLRLEAASGQILATAPLPTEPVIKALRLSPDGAYLALWSPEAGAVFTEGSAKRGQQIHRFMYLDGGLAVLDAHTLEPLAMDTQGLHGADDVCFDPDSKSLYVANRVSREVTVWAR